jgi:hypothetical protein
MSKRDVRETLLKIVVELGTKEIVFALAAALALMACSSKAPSKIAGAPSRVPDDSYETDGGLAWRVLVWKCDATNERVTMIQECGEGLTGCEAWKLDRTLCPLLPADRDATRTSMEREVESRGKGRHPIPAGYGWR